MSEKSKNLVMAKESPQTVNQLKLVQGPTSGRLKMDASSAIHLTCQFLTILGLWRLGDKPGRFSWRLILSKFLLISCYFIIGLRTVPTFLYIWLDVKNPRLMLTLLARLLFCFMTGSKYVFLMVHRAEIEECLKQVKLDWMTVKTSVNRKIMLEHSRFGQLVTKICAIVSFTIAVAYLIIPYVSKNEAPAGTVDDNMTQIVPVRSFPVPCHFGTSLALATPFYEFIITCQVLASLLVHSIEIASFSIAAVSVTHACGQLKILMNKIDHLIGENEKNTAESNGFDNKLADVIRHHVRTLRFIESAEKILREICLIDLGGYTVELCFMGYLVILACNEEHKNVFVICSHMTLIMTWTLHIFSFCYVGELLTEECTKVGEITYMIDWYRLPGKQPLALCLIITMAQNPVTLTAGGAIQLSFICFASVIKTVVGYINILRALMD